MSPRVSCDALLLASLVGLGSSSAAGCGARPRAAAPGIELEGPNEVRASATDAGAPSSLNSGLIAAGADPSAAADAIAAAAEGRDSAFVYSRDPPLAERARDVAQHPIHIHESWWSFRANHLRISEAEAQRRDARISGARAPAGFWDSQTAVEAVSVWTVLCNECHGGRRSLADAAEMPAPAPAWGEQTGLFFGNRRSYRQLFDTVHDGGPLKADGRVGMPAWRNILSNEMIWALLYFLEYQSGGIESRFPPSLFPRRPKLLEEPAE